MKKILSIVLLLALCLSAFTACVNKKEPAGLTAAKDYLYTMYKDKAEATPSDYQLVGVVVVEGVTYTLTWKIEAVEGSDVSSITVSAMDEKKMITVDVPAEPDADIAYKLVATITDAEGNSTSVSFDRMVPKFKISSFADYAAAENKAPLVVQGIVTGIVSKADGWSANALYLQDENNEGGYYVYNLTDDPVAAGIKVGMTVRVTGVKDLYSGTYELIDATVEVKDTTIKTVTPVDYTEVFTNATKLDDATLVAKQGMLVTIKNVEITGQNLTQGYFHFKLGELESYIRISSSNNCINKTAVDEFKAGHTEHQGWLANVTGIISQFNGAFYIIPAGVPCVEYLSEIQKTPAEKVEIELGNLSVTENVTADTVITLPLTGSRYEDVTFAWALTENACASYDATTGKLTVTLPEAATKITLTLTVTCGEATQTQTFEIAVDAATTDQYVPEKAETPAADTAYKFYYYQAVLGKYLYLSGQMDGYYLGTTDKADKAVDVYLEAVEGGYKLYIMDGEAKKYINVFKSGNYTNVEYADATDNVFKYDAALGAWVVTLSDGDYYLGTYNDKKDIRPSATSYISGDNAANVGVTQHVCQIGKLVPATEAPEKVEAPAADTAYKFYYYQAVLGKYLYLSGQMDGYYLGTTDKADKAVDVYLEAVEGGYKLYIMDGEAKKYINVFKSGNYTNVEYADATDNVFKYDAALGAWVVTLSDGDYYLGTYNDKKDIRPSATSYISGDNAANVGVTQHVCQIGTMTLKKLVATSVTAPEADTAYKLYYYQAVLGQNLYLSGKMDGYYLGTTDKLSKAVDVYVEVVDGGYKLYVMDGEAKKYINVFKSGNYTNIEYADATENVYTYSTELNAWVVTLSDGDYYIGTYNDKKDIRPSATSYISGSNAANVGVTQHVVYLATFAPEA